MTERLGNSLVAAGGLGLLVVALALVPQGWWAAVASCGPVLIPVAVSTAALITGVLLCRRGGQKREASAAPTPPDRQVQPLPSWAIPAGIAVVGVVTWIALAWLQGSVPMVSDPVQQAQLRVESIRTGLTIGAAVTGAFALLLAFRRQQLAERSQQASEYDAGEKRVTELYVKAAEQLGSDKAPVRLAGLYALERLAQDNPIHRQSIVEVICAYLRMPFVPPDGEPTSDDPDSDETFVDPREERQVRFTAQRILAGHLRPIAHGTQPNPSYWGPTVVLDLAEASLINVDFSGCHFHDADFTSATFYGRNTFEGATFSGKAKFGRTSFVEGLESGDVMALGDVRFSRARFCSDAIFDHASFYGVAEFEQAVFSGETWFIEPTFYNGARFSGVTFHKRAIFPSGLFCNGARFDRAKFNGDANFFGADFQQSSSFTTMFHNGIRFDGATFNGDADFKGASLNGKKYEGPTAAELAALTDPVEHARLRKTQGAGLGAPVAKAGAPEVIVEFTISPKSNRQRVSE